MDPKPILGQGKNISATYTQESPKTQEVVVLVTSGQMGWGLVKVGLNRVV